MECQISEKGVNRSSVWLCLHQDAETFPWRVEMGSLAAVGRVKGVNCATAEGFQRT